MRGEFEACLQIRLVFCEVFYGVSCKGKLNDVELLYTIHKGPVDDEL